ncbi:hypothetical protein ACGFIJ_23175 [Microbispora bryophytorum]|uniref:hypothetical protein n=1 Tax=Microbispora bryophytorum TaxID=1460882 RepID=UPI0037124982
MDNEGWADSEEPLDAPALPRRLAALQGLADLGVHHDRYLTYPHHEESDGAITA